MSAREINKARALELAEDLFHKERRTYQGFGKQGSDAQKEIDECLKRLGELRDDLREGRLHDGYESAR